MFFINERRISADGCPAPLANLRVSDEDKAQPCGYWYYENQKLKLEPRQRHHHRESQGGQNDAAAEGLPFHRSLHIRTQDDLRYRKADERYETDITEVL